MTWRTRRELARWESQIRPWANDAARSLAQSIYRNTPQPVTPHQVGVVLEPGERPWIEIPIRFTNEAPIFTIKEVAAGSGRGICVSGDSGVGAQPCKPPPRAAASPHYRRKW
jgi:hypothetical protein